MKLHGDEKITKKIWYTNHSYVGNLLNQCLKWDFKNLFIYPFIYSLFKNIFINFNTGKCGMNQIKTRMKKICNKMDFGSLLRRNTLNFKGLQKHSANKVFTVRTTKTKQVIGEGVRGCTLEAHLSVAVILHYCLGSQASVSPAASCVNTRGTGYLNCFTFKHFALFGLAKE